MININVVCVNDSIKDFTVGKEYTVLATRIIQKDLLYWLLDDNNVHRWVVEKAFKPIDKFNKKHVSDLLGKYFIYDDISFTSNYGERYSDYYDFEAVLNLQSACASETLLSLPEVINLRDYLTDLIEYYSNNRKNPFIELTREQKVYKLSTKLNEISDSDIDMLFNKYYKGE